MVGDKSRTSPLPALMKPLWSRENISIKMDLRLKFSTKLHRPDFLRPRVTTKLWAWPRLLFKRQERGTQPSVVQGHEGRENKAISSLWLTRFTLCSNPVTGAWEPWRFLLPRRGTARSSSTTPHLLRQEVLMSGVPGTTQCHRDK